MGFFSFLLGSNGAKLWPAEAGQQGMESRIARASRSNPDV